MRVQVSPLAWELLRIRYRAFLGRAELVQALHLIFGELEPGHCQRVVQVGHTFHTDDRTSDSVTLKVPAEGYGRHGLLCLLGDFLELVEDIPRPVLVPAAPTRKVPVPLSSTHARVLFRLLVSLELAG